VRFRRVVPAIVVPSLVLTCLGSAAAFQSGTAHAAAATSATGLPVIGVSQIVADTAHGHLFIIQAPYGESPVLVTTLSGNPVATLADAVQNMTLSPDGQTLYADNGDAVTAISTATLRQTASYPLPSGDRAAGLAVQSGRLWVSYQISGASNGIGAIDLANGSADWNSVTGDWVPLPPAIAADPSDTGILVASSLGETPGTVATYNVSNPSAVSQTASSTSLNCGAASELAVVPGGKTFLCGGAQYSTATLAAQNSPFMGSGPTAVAPDGALAVGSSSLNVTTPGANTETDAYGQFWGVPLPLSYDVDSWSPVALAWGADSQRLFTVVESTSEFASPIFQVVTLYPFQRVTADLALTTTATTVGYREPVTVTPQLGMTYANRSFSVYETVAGSAKHLIWSGAADPGGDHVSFGDDPPHNVTFTMVFAGDARYKPTTVSLTVGVKVDVSAALRGYYRTTTASGTSYRVYHRTATLKDAVTVTPAKRGECVELQSQEYSKGAWHPVTTTKCGTLNKSSQATVALKLTALGRFRVWAYFVHAKTDTANLSTTGSWQYYEVTK
jgi:hypothetical protein